VNFSKSFINNNNAIDYMGRFMILYSNQNHIIIVRKPDDVTANTILGNSRIGAPIRIQRIGTGKQWF